MSTFSSPADVLDKGAKCEVCFAGAVMARATGFDPYNHIGFSQFTTKNKRVFSALDAARSYSFRHMLDGFFRYRRPSVKWKPAASALEDHFEDYNTNVEYEDCPSTFKRNMETIAAILVEHGL